MSVFQAPQSVVVVGGGIIGSSIAWHLSQSNTTHTTVVASQFGGTATPNSFAWINAISAESDSYFEFRHRSIARWHEIEQEVPELSQFIHWGGSLNWEIKNTTERDEYVKKKEALGWGVVTVDKTQIESTYEPDLSPDFLPNSPVLALRSAEEGQMEARVVAERLIDQAQLNGAAIIENNVTSFLKQDGKIAGVILGGGEEIHADHVILASGLGAVPLLAAEGVDLPLHPIAGLLMNTRATKKVALKTVSYSGDLHIRQTPDGRIIAGADYGGSDPGNDAQAVADGLFKSIKAAVEGGDDVEYGYYTIGYRPTPGDGFPIIGDTGVDGVSVAVMHSGVSNAAIVGQLLTKQVLTGEKDPDLSNYLLSRFNGKSTKLSRKVKLFE